MIFMCLEICKKLRLAIKNKTKEPKLTYYWQFNRLYFGNSYLEGKV